MTIDIPVAVQQAATLSHSLGVTNSCRAETGKLLSVMASSIAIGHILELGTGGGYGTAWLATGLRPATTLTSVDINARLAASVAHFYATHPSIRVRCETWQQGLERGPFDLDFVDVSEAKSDGIDAVMRAVKPGGMVILDDLTPLDLWTEEWRGKPDPIRDAWLGHPSLDATEIRVAPDTSIILGVRH